jgi:hypothetical protein
MGGGLLTLSGLLMLLEKWPGQSGAAPSFCQLNYARPFEHAPGFEPGSSSGKDNGVATAQASHLVGKKVRIIAIRRWGWIWCSTH